MQRLCNSIAATFKCVCVCVCVCVWVGMSMATSLCCREADVNAGYLIAGIHNAKGSLCSDV